MTPQVFVGRGGLAVVKRQRSIAFTPSAAAVVATPWLARLVSHPSGSSSAVPSQSSSIWFPGMS
jgi:hypothetical protein